MTDILNIAEGTMTDGETRETGQGRGRFAQWLSCLSAADRKDLRWLGVGGLGMGFFTGLQAGGDAAGLSAANIGMILATLAFLALTIRHWLRISGRQDEMYRQIEGFGLRAAGIAVVALAVLSGLLELHLGTPVVPIWVAIPVFMVTLVAGTVIAGRRYE